MLIIHENDKMNSIFNVANIIFRAIPFLSTIGMCLDFTFAKTSLMFMEWQKMEAIYFNAYSAIIRNISRKKKFFGIQMGLGEKLGYGVVMTLVQIVLVFLPLI